MSCRSASFAAMPPVEPPVPWFRIRCLRVACREVTRDAGRYYKTMQEQAKKIARMEKKFNETTKDLKMQLAKAKQDLKRAQRKGTTTKAKQ